MGGNQRTRLLFSFGRFFFFFVFFHNGKKWLFFVSVFLLMPIKQNENPKKERKTNKKLKKINKNNEIIKSNDGNSFVDVKRQMPETDRHACRFTPPTAFSFCFIFFSSCIIWFFFFCFSHFFVCVCVYRLYNKETFWNHIPPPSFLYFIILLV